MRTASTTALLLLLASPAGAPATGKPPLPEFTVSKADLPRAAIGDFKITFMPNGAFVVAWRGRYLLDGGIGFCLPGWKRWGEQIRGTGMQAAHEPVRGTSGISFVDRVCDDEGKPVLALKQTVVGIPGGLRFDYALEALEALQFFHLGWTCHWPVSRYMGQRIELCPGFAAGSLGKTPRKTPLRMTTSRYMTLYFEGAPFVSIVPRRTAKWIAFDDRVFQLNVARLWCTPAIPLRMPKVGHRVRIGFDMHLRPQAPLPEVEAGAARMHLDYVGVGHLHVGRTRVAQMGLCWRAKPDEAWRYALSAPRTPARDADTGRLVFEGAAGKAFQFGCAARAEDGRVVAGWSASVVTGRLPSEMGVWLLLPKQAKVVLPGRDRGPGERRSVSIQIDARTALTAESAGEWSAQEVKLWGTTGQMAISKFSGQAQPTTWHRVAVHVFRQDATASPKGTAAGGGASQHE